MQEFKRKALLLMQILLVATFIIFEEIIWEGLAKPIYTYVHSLRILQKLEMKLKQANAYLVLVLFVLLLVGVEMMGVYAGVLFVSGHVFMGSLTYLMKVPIAAFTFWLFRTTESKLMRFGWFKKLYELLMKGIEWLKASSVYQETIKQVAYIKAISRKWLIYLKSTYFSQENIFMARLKRIYSYMKHIWKTQ